MGENIFKNSAQWRKFWMAQIFFLQNVARWRYCDGAKILAEITARWRKDLKSGARRGGAN